MQGVGWLPITPLDLDLPYWTGIWLGVFPTVETVLAQLRSVAFVLGSYVLAERLKRRPRRREAPSHAGASPPPQSVGNRTQAETQLR